MRIGNHFRSSGAIALAAIALGLAMSVSATAYRHQWLAIGSAMAYWAGWALLLAWLVGGQRHRFSLRHTTRVALWMAAAIYLSLAVGQIEQQFTGIAVAPLGLISLFLGIGTAFAGLGWSETDWGVSHHLGWNDGNNWDAGSAWGDGQDGTDGGSGGGWFDGGFDLDMDA
jgi:hypothetical protein